MKQNFEHNLERVEQAMDSLRRALAGARERLGEGLQLTRTQLEIIIMLAEEPKTTSELAGQLALTQSAVTQTLDTLVRRDLVGRRPSTADRRVVRLELTASGRELTDHLRRLRRRHFELLLRELSETEVEALITITRKLTSLYNQQT